MALSKTIFARISDGGRLRACWEGEDLGSLTWEEVIKGYAKPNLDPGMYVGIYTGLDSATGLISNLLWGVAFTLKDDGTVIMGIEQSASATPPSLFTTWPPRKRS